MGHGVVLGVLGGIGNWRKLYRDLEGDRMIPGIDWIRSLFGGGLVE